MSDPFTDYQRIAHRTSDLIAFYRTKYDPESAIGIVLEHLEREYAMIIADETYSKPIRELDGSVTGGRIPE